MLTLGGLRRGALTVVATLGLLLLAGCTPVTNTGEQRGASPFPTGTPSQSPSAAVRPSSGPTQPPATGGVVPESKPTAAPAPPAGSANVQIANARYDPGASAIVVAAMVTDRISSTGTCTLEASWGATSLSTQVAAVADATVTYCGPLTVSVPPGSSGQWSISVSYTDGPIKGLVAGEVTVP